MKSQGCSTLILQYMNVLTYRFGVLAGGRRHFDWLDSLRGHISVNEIMQVQEMSERDANRGDLQWGGVTEECKIELSCVRQKVAQSVGW